MTAVPTRPARHMRARPAFTMIELLLVLTLIGAIAAIAIRSVGDTIRRDRVVKTAAIVSTDARGIVCPR